MLAVRHYGGDLSAFGGDLILRAGQSPRVNAAIRAPMPAMESHRNGPLLQQRVETDELAGFVGQHELWHRLPRLGRVLADIVLPQPIHQLINRRLKLRAEPPYRVGEGLQPLCQGRIHVAALNEGFFEQFRERLRVHPTVLQPGRRALAENSPLSGTPVSALFIPSGIHDV